MSRKEISVDNVAEAYLALLAERGIDYLFANAGTDFAPLVEAFAKAARTGRAVPQPVLATHENLAFSMAHGYAMVSRRVPAVMVHVSVGTANGICGALNAARDNIADIVHRRTLAADRERASGSARRLYPLGPGDVRPGRDAARDRQMGIRIAQRPAARNGDRPRPGGGDDPACRPGLSFTAARGPGGAAARFFL